MQWIWMTQGQKVQNDKDSFWIHLFANFDSLTSLGQTEMVKDISFSLKVNIIMFFVIDLLGSYVVWKVV